jgi:hypothetical protein
VEFIEIRLSVNNHLRKTAVGFVMFDDDDDDDDNNNARKARN